MAHISSIGAALFTDFSVATPATELTKGELEALDSSTEFFALFATEISNFGGTRAAGAFVRISNLREIPQLGDAPNIVNVPEFGQKTSSSIQAQSDAPSMELQINYVPANWAPTTILGAMKGDDKQRVFRIALLPSAPAGGYASSSAGLGTAPNSQYFFVGKVEAIQFQPSLSDATIGTLTLSVQGKTYGAFTNDV